MCPGPTLRVPAVSVVMGIPSVRREVHSYLTDTLHSLISELSPQEKEDSVIVVLIAEASGRGQAGGTQCGACSRKGQGEENCRVSEEETRKFSWFHPQTCHGKNGKSLLSPPEDVELHSPPHPLAPGV